jgi:hypothetical protein
MRITRQASPYERALLPARPRLGRAFFAFRRKIRTYGETATSRVTGGIRTHMDQVHSLALYRIELRPQRRRQESNLHPTEVAAPRLTTRPRRQRKKHAGQGSNLSLPVLETGVPPLELPACGYRANTKMRREGFEPPSCPEDIQGYSLVQSTTLPPARELSRGKPPAK